MKINGTLVSLWMLAGTAASVLDQGAGVRADPVTGLVLVGVGLAIVAGMLLNKPKIPAQSRDTRTPTTSSRGEQLGYVIGRRIISPKVLWVGSRQPREEEVSSGGGKGGKRKSKQIVYYEDAMHAICLGPASCLYQILQNQKPIFTGPISPDTTPSGSTLQDTDGNYFRIYWGTKNQPVDADLAADTRMGVASRWPFVCYIFWLQRRLGTSATWPTLDYDIECADIGFSLPGSLPYFSESTPGAQDTGVNGAHSLNQLLCGRYPHGAGIDPSAIDFGRLNALGALIEAERIPQNILIAEGASLLDVLDDMLGDLGVLCVEEEGKICFMPIREAVSPPTLDDRMVVIPRPQFDIDHGTPFERVEFTYPDIKEMFRSTDLPIDDDATARYLDRKNTTSQALPTITDQATAAKVADRRKALYFSEARQLSFKASRTARRLSPGFVCLLPDIGEIRITAIERDSKSPQISVSAAINAFSLIESGWNPNVPPSSPGASLQTLDDEIIPVELPHEVVGETLAVGIIRVRRDGQAPLATVWGSLDGTSYASLGEQPVPASGATLLEALPADTQTILESGPLIHSTTEAMARVLDLTSVPTSWLTGAQLCVIGGTEVAFLQAIATDSGEHRLLGLIRGRLGTQPQSHPVGTTIAIVQSDSIEPFTNQYAWAPGQTLRFKVAPANIGLDLVDAVPLTLAGKALGPLPVDNVTPRWRGSGDGVTLTWTDRIRRGTGCGAGEGVFGQTIGDTPAREADDYLIEILDSGGRVRRTDTMTTESFTYSYSDQTTDGTADRDFSVRITPRKGSFGGYPTTWLVEGVT